MRSQRRQLPGNTAGCARRKHGKAHSAWVDTNVGSIITIMRIRSRFGASAAPRRSGPFVTNARAPKKSSNQLEPKAARYVKWDGALPGLCIRVEPSGTKTFVLRYRPAGTGRDGPKRFLKIGRYDPLTPHEARRQAREILGQVASGKDPTADLAVGRATITVADLAARYRRRGHAEAQGPYYCPLCPLPQPFREMGKIKADSVTRATVSKLHLRLGRTKQVTANRVLDTVSGMFRFGDRSGLLPPNFVNPAKNTEIFNATARDRFLSGDELERLGAPRSARRKQ